MTAEEYFKKRDTEITDRDVYGFHHESTIIQLMDEYADHKQKLNTRGVVRPCSDSAVGGEQLGSEAVATKPAREVCLRGGEKLFDGECSRCSLLWGKACAELP